jgi:hypothetical protein
MHQSSLPLQVCKQGIVLMGHNGYCSPALVVESPPQHGLSSIVASAILERHACIEQLRHHLAVHIRRAQSADLVHRHNDHSNLASLAAALRTFWWCHGAEAGAAEEQCTAVS